MTTPIPGHMYRHFKGFLVRVLYVAKSTDNLEPLVVYRHTESDVVWVRTLKEFQDVLEDGRSRFEPVQCSVFTYEDLSDLIHRVEWYIKDWCGGKCHCRSVDYCLRINERTPLYDLQCPGQIFMSSLKFQRGWKK